MTRSNHGLVYNPTGFIYLHNHRHLNLADQ